MKTIITLICFGLIAGSTNCIAQTQTYIWQFSGSTTNTTVIGIPDGSQYSGELSYVVPQPDLDSRPDVGVYRFSSFTIQIGSDIISAAPLASENRFFVLDRSTSTGGDQLVSEGFAGISGTIGTLTGVNAFLVAFSDSTGNAFSSDSPPIGSFSRADFQFANISILGTLQNGVSWSFGGSVDHLVVVPTPSAFSSALTALIGLALVAGVGCRKKASESLSA